MKEEFTAETGRSRHTWCENEYLRATERVDSRRALISWWREMVNQWPCRCSRDMVLWVFFIVWQAQNAILDFSFLIWIKNVIEQNSCSVKKLVLVHPTEKRKKIVKLFYPSRFLKISTASLGILLKLGALVNFNFFF